MLIVTDRVLYGANHPLVDVQAYARTFAGLARRGQARADRLAEC